MDYAKNSALFIIIAVILNGISVWIESDFLEKFLDDNLITLLIALLAINTTTIGLLSTKLRELHDENQIDFSNSIHSMKSSITEQVILVILAAIVSIIKGSPWLTSFWSWLPFIYNSILITIFVYSIHILYDTANGIFVILQSENST